MVDLVTEGAKIFREIFSEGMMGFLALVALTCVLVPIFFDLSGAASWLNGLSWFVVAIFLAEYMLALLEAPSKARFVRSPLRVLMAATLLLAFASILESVPDSFVAAPSLRVVHVILAVVLGLQAGALTVDQRREEDKDQRTEDRAVSVLDPDGELRDASWLELLEWSERPTRCWYHAKRVRPGDLSELAAKWGVPLSILQVCLGEQNYPRLDFFGRTVLLSIWLRGASGKQGTSEAAPVVLLVREDAVVSISSADADLQQRIDNQAIELLMPGMPFASRMVYAVIELVLEGSASRIDACESRLREMERTSVGKARPSLFADAYSIKQELSALYSDLWRVKDVISRIEAGKVGLPGAAGGFGQIGRHVDFLYTTVDNLRESVISLIDLHMNSASFEMTKFMRLLAVVNVLALIPAVVGGLLGMNVAGAPWPVSLSQVTFLTVMANIFCTYYFVIKGWLR